MPKKLIKLSINLYKYFYIKLHNITYTYIKQALVNSNKIQLKQKRKFMKISLIKMKKF